MRNKPILKIIVVLAFLAGAALLFGCKSKTADMNDTDAILDFTDRFCSQLQRGQADSLKTSFFPGAAPKILERLAGILSNQTNFNDKNKAVLNAEVRAGQISTTSQVVPHQYAVFIPVNLGYRDDPKRTARLYLTITKTDAGKFVITRLNVREFMKSYIAFERGPKKSDKDDSLKFSPVTLAAFKNVSKLRAKYDSVVWFEHLNKQTYYYVVKGQWDENDFQKDTIPFKELSYKMGLAGPDLKEIIPPLYDVIHNVNGTVDGLIEVQKKDKKGFFDLTGKAIVPVEFNELIPLKDEADLALLRKGDDYYYLKSDFTISDKLTGFKIADAIPRIKNCINTHRYSDSSQVDIMEYTNRYSTGEGLIITPSYLVDWDILPALITINDPYHDVYLQTPELAAQDYYEVAFVDHQKKPGNWFESIYYDIKTYYEEGRGGLYGSKAVLLVDKKQNRIQGHSYNTYEGAAEGSGILNGDCTVNDMRTIADNVFELKTTSDMDQQLLSGSFIHEAVFYRYLSLKNDRLKPKDTKRLFAFTQFVQMDDTYLDGCYMIGPQQEMGGNLKRISMNADILQYMKNEIYASYGYKFKKPEWAAIFAFRFPDPNNDNVDASLTPIDKYNITFIANKLKQISAKSKVLAAK